MHSSSRPCARPSPWTAWSRRPSASSRPTRSAGGRSDSHSIHGDDVKEIVFEEHEGGEVYELTADGRRATGHRCSRGSRRTGSCSRGTSSSGSRPDRGRGSVHARRRHDPRRARASRLGSRRRRPRGQARQLRDGLGARARLLLSDGSASQTPTSTGSTGALPRAASGQGTGGGEERTRSPPPPARQCPPADVDHVLGPQLRPAQARLRLERRRAHQVVPLGLAVPAPLSERDDMRASPDERTELELLEPCFLQQLAADCRSSVSPSSIPPPGIAQTRAVAEVEAHEKDVLVLVQDDCAHGGRSRGSFTRPARAARETSAAARPTAPRHSRATSTGARRVRSRRAALLKPVLDAPAERPV